MVLVAAIVFIIGAGQRRWRDRVMLLRWLMVMEVVVLTPLELLAGGGRGEGPRGGVEGREEETGATVRLRPADERGENGEAATGGGGGEDTRGGG